MGDKALQTLHETFAKAEGSKDGKLSPERVKKWFKDSGVIGKDTGINEADLDTVMSKTCKDKKGVEFSEVKETIKALAKEKKVEPKQLMEKLASAGPMKTAGHGAEAKCEKAKCEKEK